MVSYKQIEEVVGRSKQGTTQPFICRAEDGEIYFVKGKFAGKHSLIAEYICNALAKKVGIPVADFEIVDVSDTLIDATLMEDIGDLGVGYAFASKAVRPSQELQMLHCDRIAPDLKKAILLFDLWVHNEDRTLSENGGNPNLLWNQQTDQLVVIDFNIAFEKQFSKPLFTENHIFSALMPEILNTPAQQDVFRKRFIEALDCFDEISAKVPDEWWYHEDGSPALLTKETIRTTLEEIREDRFWTIES